MNEKALVSLERIENRILLIRGQKVILDSDLGELYGVTTKRLNEQVKRNAVRFPDDFMFQLNPDEQNELVAKCDRFARLKHSSVPAHAFTEHGAIMAASVLSSPRAVEASIYVVRAFVRLRQMLSSHTELAGKLDKLERKLATHDEQILLLIDLLHQLTTPPEPDKHKRIGFSTGQDQA